MTQELTTTNQHGQELAQAQNGLKTANNSISVFFGATATQEQIKHAVQKLQICFPKMSSAFFALLVERLVSNKVTGDRLTYMINKVIDTFHYQQLTIADIIDLDLRVDRMTYDDVFRIYKQFPTRHVVKVEAPTPYYLKTEDVDKYGLENYFKVKRYKI